MKILGIDISFAHTGYSLVEKTDTLKLLFCGCIPTEKDKNAKSVALDDVRRNRILYNGLIEVIKTHNPDKIVIELPISGGKSAAALKALSYSSAIAAIITLQFDIPYEFITPISSKRLVSGGDVRKVEKDEMMAYVKENYGYMDWPKKKGDFEHIADSFVAILVDINKNKGG